MNSFLESLPQFLLFGSVIYFYISFIIILAIFFWSDAKEMGFHAFAAFLVFITIMHFYSDWDPIGITSWGQVGLYLLMGFIHSLIRTYFYGRKPIPKAFEHYPNGRSTDDEIEIHKNNIIKDRKSHLKGNVFRWWFLFPISFINWVFSDLIRDVYNFIYSQLQRLYEGVLNLGLKQSS